MTTGKIVDCPDRTPEITDPKFVLPLPSCSADGAGPPEANVSYDEHRGRAEMKQSGADQSTSSPDKSMRLDPVVAADRSRRLFVISTKGPDRNFSIAKSAAECCEGSTHDYALGNKWSSRGWITCRRLAIRNELCANHLSKTLNLAPLNCATFEASDKGPYGETYGQLNPSVEAIRVVLTFSSCLSLYTRRHTTKQQTINQCASLIGGRF